MQNQPSEAGPSLKPCPQCGTMVQFNLQDGRHICPQCGYLLPEQVAHYKLLQIIGTGGMGAVYRGLDISLERNVAVKVMREEFAKNPQFVESFLREARAAASLNHPNVAQIYSFGEQEGRYYLVMELLPGGSLDDRIEKEHHVSEVDVLDVGIQVASGLRAAYERGLIHRDIKPGNILFSQDGTAKVVDFGLARFVTKAAAQHQEEGIWGTPYYIAPEKVSQNKEDFRSDIYSLGGTLFHALAGRPPFDAGTSTEVVLKHLHSPAVSLKTFAPDSTDQTAEVIGRMLRRDPADRPKSYDELINALAYAKRFALEKRPRAALAEEDRDLPIGMLVSTVAMIALTLALLVWGWYHRSKIFGESPGSAAVSTNSITPTANTEAVSPAPQPQVATRDEFLIDIDNAHEIANREGASSAIPRFEDILNRLPPNHELRPWVKLHLARAKLMTGRDAPELVELSGTRTADSYANGVSPADYPFFLALLLQGKVPQDVFSRAISGMPSWMQAISHFDAGFAAQKLDRLTDTARYWRAYSDMTKGPDEEWAFAYQTLALNFVNEYEQYQTMASDIMTLQNAGRVEQVATLLKEKQVIWQNPSIRTRVDKLTEVNHAALARKRADQEEKARQEAARQQEIDAENRLVENARRQRVGYLQGYQFDALLDSWQKLSSQVKSDSNRKVVQYHIEVDKLLEEFKQVLTEDIQDHPYEDQNITTKTNLKMVGILSEVREEKLIFRTQFAPGQIAETACKWSDLYPSTILEIAEYYLDRDEKTSGANANDLARRALMIAVFTREYALSEGKMQKYLAYAMNAQANIRNQVDLLFPPVVPR